MRGYVPYEGRGEVPLLPLVAHFHFPICYSTRSSSVFAQRRKAPLFGSKLATATQRSPLVGRLGFEPRTCRL